MLMCFFFFKQKTAYERRISDWSSDVCSSDLMSGEQQLHRRFGPDAEVQMVAALNDVDAARRIDALDRVGRDEPDLAGQRGKGVGQLARDTLQPRQIEYGRASCRERVGQYV